MLLHDVVLVDGTGAPARPADVRVRGERIAVVAERRGLAPMPGERVIDGRGRVLAPGFIDMHAHSDLELLRPGDHAAKLAQGVTTEVIGQDGLSYAPVDDAALADIRARIAGWHGDLPDAEFTWRDVGGYLDRLDAGVAVNAAYLVPQGNLRMLVVGHGARSATAEEIRRMRGLLADGLRAGAFGMSSGLTYAPGMHADREELVALCRVVAEHGGFWAPHTRGYGGGAREAYSEAIEIAHDAGCAVHLTHATMNFPSNAGRADALLALVDRAIADGVDVTLDTYPYRSGATTLAALLPSWAAEGGIEATLARLEDPGEAERIRVAVEETGSDGAHGEPIDWETIQISGVTDPALSVAVGRTVAELGRSRPVELGSPPSAFDAALALLRRDRLRTGILMHVGHEGNVRRIMAHPRHMGGSDGILVGDRPHPRGWGTFARYLRRYSRELGILGLEEVVRHLSGAPARRLGLADRGEVRVGAVADLALFDPARVRDEATYDDPRRPATGMDLVLVGGRVAVEDGRISGIRAGRSLRRAAAR
ncbi:MULTISPECIES: N-acyl-D-amino-acid deacylase family protein [unclassified Microbacterium]|uniref:N-acyl-D-amino-acid deacylase family protein n=1 Tax=unclassified Microbacterium TaxID=2609290 RepID=UPI003018F041